MRRRARERQEKREDRPILKRLRATLLRLFRRLHGEKMVCMGAMPGVTGTLGKDNSYFDPTKRGRGRHHHVEAVVDWCGSILLALHNILYIGRKFRTSLSKRSESILF